MKLKNVTMNQIILKNKEKVIDKSKQMFYNLAQGGKMRRQILHIDVNNAFLSWTAVERLNNGETLDIRTIPAIIGGDEKQRHGIVLAKSMLAKQFGIKTGEPIYFARKKCPSLRIYPSNFNVYHKYSDALYEIFTQYTEKIERFSIDECFLEMTDYIPMGRTIEQIAVEIKERVKEELGFTVNIGIAPNKLLAKMASDFEKPDKIHTLWEEEIPTKMWNLPVSELFMVGKKTLPKLANRNIKTIGDLAKWEKQELIKRFGKYGKTLWEYANGIDYSEVEYEKQKPKGIGNSTTLAQDIWDIEKLEEILLTLTEQVAYRLRKENLLAGVVNVQIKTNEFRNFSHQRKLNVATDSTKMLFIEAKKLLKELREKADKPVRLIGVRVDDLQNREEMQLTLFDNSKENEKQERLDKTVDFLKDKYGYDTILRAKEMKVKNKIQFKE